MSARRKPRTRVAAQTGFRVTVGHAEDLGLQHRPDVAVWYTRCDEHNESVGHRTQKLADSHAVEPIEWCDGCRNLAYEVNRSALRALAATLIEFCFHGDLQDVASSDARQIAHKIKNDTHLARHEVKRACELLGQGRKAQVTRLWPTTQWEKN